MTENNKIDFETIDYSKVNPKKLNGNKRIVKSYLIYFAFDVVLTVAIFLLTLFKLIDSSDNMVNTVIFILSGILCLCLYANNYYKSKDWRFYESLRSDTLTKLIALFTEGYGGYDLTLGWAIIVVLLVFGVLVNLTSRKEAN